MTRADTPPPPPPRTEWTRRVPHPVLIGHAASAQRLSLRHSRRNDREGRLLALGAGRSPRGVGLRA